MKISTSKDRLNELINILGISQKQFADRTGLACSTVSMYLNGKREPRQDGIAMISQAFNIDPAWLMGYDVNMHIEKPSKEDVARLGKLINRNPKRALEILELIIPMDDDEYNAYITLMKK